MGNASPKGGFSCFDFWFLVLICLFGFVFVCFMVWYFLLYCLGVWFVFKLDLMVRNFW